MKDNRKNEIRNNDIITAEGYEIEGKEYLYRLMSYLCFCCYQEEYEDFEKWEDWVYVTLETAELLLFFFLSQMYDCAVCNNWKVGAKLYCYFDGTEEGRFEYFKESNKEWTILYCRFLDRHGLINARFYDSNNKRVSCTEIENISHVIVDTVMTDLIMSLYEFAQEYDDELYEEFGWEEAHNGTLLLVEAT